MDEPVTGQLLTADTGPRHIVVSKSAVFGTSTITIDGYPADEAERILTLWQHGFPSPTAELIAGDPTAVPTIVKGRNL